jgi:2-dehydropantoate 2-reductase
MRYIVIGAGAIGGVLGARIAQHAPGHPPVLVARGDHESVMKTQGIRLRTPDEDVRLAIDVAGGPAGVRLRSDDVLVLTVKTQQAEVALAEWVDQPVYDDSDQVVGTAGERLPIFIAMNGVEAERLALRRFRRVFGVSVWLPAVHLEPGEVILRIAPVSGTFIVGRIGTEADAADHTLLETVAADLEAATFTVHVVEDVMRWKYNKLLSNLANGLQAILGVGEDFGDLVSRLRVEAQLVFRESGIEWASELEEAEWRGDNFAIRHVPGTPEALGGSTWQSVTRGTGSVETDYLNGEIALLARLHGLDAPLNETVQRISREVARGDTAAESMTVEELKALLG